MLSKKEEETGVSHLVQSNRREKLVKISFLVIFVSSVQQEVGTPSYSYRGKTKNDGFFSVAGHIFPSDY